MTTSPLPVTSREDFLRAAAFAEERMMHLQLQIGDLRDELEEAWQDRERNLLAAEELAP